MPGSVLATLDDFDMLAERRLIMYWLACAA